MEVLTQEGVTMTMEGKNMRRDIHIVRRGQGR